MRMQLEETVAIVVDYQERLMPAMYNEVELTECARRLLEGLKVLEVPMILTQQYTKGLGETIQVLKDASGEISHVEKLRFSAYEDIKEQIQEKKYVIVCGVEAHICVLQTAMDLAHNGYVPILVVDCISSRKQLDCDIALERAKQEGILLTTHEAVLFELLETAGTASSKAIQKIIK